MVVVPVHLSEARPHIVGAEDTIGCVVEEARTVTVVWHVALPFCPPGDERLSLPLERCVDVRVVDHGLIAVGCDEFDLVTFSGSAYKVTEIPDCGPPYDLIDFAEVDIFLGVPEIIRIERGALEPESNAAFA